MAWPDLDSQLVHLLCERRPDLDYASNGAPRGTTGIMAWPTLTRRLLTYYSDLDYASTAYRGVQPT